MMKKIFYFTILLLVALVSVRKAVASVSFTEKQLLANINNARVAADMTGYTQAYMGSALERAAHAKLADMQKYKYWSHDNPVTQEQWWKIIYKMGVRGKVAENLARGYSDSAKVVSGWEASAAHHTNLFSQVYKKVGLAIGEVEYKEGTKTVVVAVFGE